MRIPTSDVYRAFPELDRFSDDRCREFVAHAQANRRLSRAVNSLGALLAAAIVRVIVASLWIMVLASQSFGLDSWLLVAVVSTTVMSGAVVGLLIRDRWLRWAVGQQLAAARCPACRYSLLGIPAIQGVITCPECGAGRRVEDLDLSPEQVAQLSVDLGHQASPPIRGAARSKVIEGLDHAAHSFARRSRPLRTGRSPEGPSMHVVPKSGENSPHRALMSLELPSKGEHEVRAGRDSTAAPQGPAAPP